MLLNIYGYDTVEIVCLLGLNIFFHSFSLKLEIFKVSKCTVFEGKNLTDWGILSTYYHRHSYRFQGQKITPPVDPRRERPTFIRLWFFLPEKAGKAIGNGLGWRKVMAQKTSCGLIRTAIRNLPLVTGKIGDFNKI